ncbi:MAG: DUF3096 domain-containing protein [Porticoccaceae bacterium]
MASCEAHGAQRPSHIKSIGEGASTAQRSRWPPQQFFNKLLMFAPLISLTAGILILVMPRLLNYVAIYLMVIGLVRLLGGSNVHMR